MAIILIIPIATHVFRLYKAASIVDAPLIISSYAHIDRSLPFLSPCFSSPSRLNDFAPVLSSRILFSIFRKLFPLLLLLLLLLGSGPEGADDLCFHT